MPFPPMAKPRTRRADPAGAGIPSSAGLTPGHPGSAESIPVPSGNDPAQTPAPARRWRQPARRVRWHRPALAAGLPARARAEIGDVRTQPAPGIGRELRIPGTGARLIAGEFRMVVRDAETSRGIG